MKNKKDKSLIPHGDYCYDKNGLCPYWSKDENRPDQESGYCAFLEKGDWDTNASKEKTITMHPSGEKKSPSEMPIGIGLLWDQVKECCINEYTDEEMEQWMRGQTRYFVRQKRFSKLKIEH